MMLIALAFSWFFKICNNECIYEVEENRLLVLIRRFCKWVVNYWCSQTMAVGNRQIKKALSDNKNKRRLYRFYFKSFVQSFTSYNVICEVFSSLDYSYFIICRVLVGSTHVLCVLIVHNFYPEKEKSCGYGNLNETWNWRRKFCQVKTFKCYQGKPWILNCLGRSRTQRMEGKCGERNQTNIKHSSLFFAYTNMSSIIPHDRLACVNEFIRFPTHFLCVVCLLCGVLWHG